MDAHTHMARMVDSVQPHCDEPVTGAMTCSHAGSMSSVLFTKLIGIPGLPRSSDLPNPVLIAVGRDTVYAFDYKPRGFKFKIKKEMARWPRGDMQVVFEQTDRMCDFTVATGSGPAYAMEVATVMGAKEVVDMFLAAMGARSA